MTETNNTAIISLQARFLRVLPVVLLLVSNLFFLVPLAIYKGNISEFDTSFVDIIKYYSVPCFFLSVLFFSVALFLPARLFSRYITVLFAMGLLIWVQGNLLPWNYGVIGRGDLDWKQFAWRGWLDGGVWALILITAYRFHKKLYVVASFAGYVLLLLQFTYAVVIITQTPRLWHRKPTLSKSFLPPNEIYRFSSTQNVVHVILDELQSDVFLEIISRDPRYYSSLKGFTFFQDATGPFPTTIMSIPAILTGHLYTNDEPMEVFIDKTYKGRSISNVLYDRGYRVDLAASLNWYSKGRHTNWYEIPIPYGVDREQYEKSHSSLLFQLVLFRSSPHFLKRIILENSIGILPVSGSDSVTTYEAKRHVAHEDFLQDIIDHMVVSRSEPAYKFFHLNTTHYPAVVDEQCRNTGKILPWVWSNIKIQDRCSLEHFVEFLDKLKILGIYDSSLIIVQADHGYYKVPNSLEQMKLINVDDSVYKDFKSREYFAQVVSSSRPLLAVKAPFDRDPFRVSRAPVMLTDIPATVSSLLGMKEDFPGRSIFNIRPDETRERTFSYYDELSNKGFFKRLDQYIISGESLDRRSWRTSAILKSKSISYETSRIDLGTPQAHNFFRSGWATNDEKYSDGSTFNWGIGKAASVFVSLPRTPFHLSAKMISPFADGQKITVSIDGRTIGNWEIDKMWEWAQERLYVQSDPRRPKVSTVEFQFEKHLDSSRPGLDKRPLAAIFDAIDIEAVRPYRWNLPVYFGKDGTSSSFQGKGWCSPENGFTWTESKSSELNIPIFDSASQDVMLKARVMAMLTENIKEQRVTLKVNGRPAGKWVIREHGFQDQTLRIPAKHLAGDVLSISFDIPGAASPESQGINSDKRVLGLAFQSITLTK